MRTAIIAFTAVALVGPAAAQKRSDHFVSGNWRGYAFHPKPGRFASCQMHARYRSGTTLYFAITGNGRFRIGLYNPKWALKEGSRHPVTLTIDRRRMYSGVARVVGLDKAKMVLIELPSSRALFNRFRAGYVLHVDAPSGRVGFSLAGSSAALDKLLRCVATNVARKSPPPATSNPFSDPADRNSTPAARTKPSDTSERVHAVTLIANLLSRVELYDYEIIPPDDVPPKWRSFHALWRARRTIGLVRVYRNVTDKDRREAYADVAAADFGDCEGAYQSGVKRDAGPGRPITFFSRCAGDKHWSIYYFIVGPDGAGRTYLVGLFSEDKNEPLEMGEKLRAALTALIARRAKKPAADPEPGVRQ